MTLSLQINEYLVSFKR